MDYQKIYNQLIDRAKNRVNPDCYTETHHIIPRCMGGSNDNDNLVVLTAREHFIAHWLLSRIFPDDRGLYYGFWIMCKMYTNKQNRYIPSSRVYEELKNNKIGPNKDNLSICPKCGKIGGKANITRYHGKFGEHCGNKERSKSFKPKNAFGYNTLSEDMLFTTRSKAGKIGGKNALSGSNSMNLQRKKCIYCNYETTPGNIVRHHNENCKHKPKL